MRTSSPLRPGAIPALSLVLLQGVRAADPFADAVVFHEPGVDGNPNYVDPETAKPHVRAAEDAKRADAAKEKADVAADEADSKAKAADAAAEEAADKAEAAKSSASKKKPKKK